MCTLRDFWTSLARKRRQQNHIFWFTAVFSFKERDKILPSKDYGDTFQTWDANTMPYAYLCIIASHKKIYKYGVVFFFSSDT